MGWIDSGNVDTCDAEAGINSNDIRAGQDQIFKAELRWVWTLPLDSAVAVPPKHRGASATCRQGTFRGGRPKEALMLSHF
jgi:hypothetical protein